MLYNIIVMPIEIIVNWVFNFIRAHFASFGVIGAVCGVSLVINFLALPLYNVADSLQEKERKASKALEPRVKRIKKAFKGNEQFMMLQTYYRQNNYSPFYVLRSSLSILIEIPFFIAAYHYLNNCEALKGASFWIFKDLGAPDGLLHIGNFSIHVLPIIMTAINFVSGAIYTKDAPFCEKIQLYLVALLFLVLLYTSPSGLVIYWILNNLFSLFKNIIMKMKHPGKVLHLFISLILLLTSTYVIIRKLNSEEPINSKRLIFFLLSLAIALFPLYKSFFKRIKIMKLESNTKNGFSILLLSGIGLTLLCGLFLPASAIATSPIEFSFMGNTDSPISYIKYALCVFSGFFIVWPVLIYKLFGKKVQKYESLLFLVALIISLLNIFIFKDDYGNLSRVFELELRTNLGKQNHIISIAVYFVIIAIIFIVYKTKAVKYVPLLLLTLSVALLGTGFVKIHSINSVYKTLSKTNMDNINYIEKEYNLSKTHKNVVILFLDRAINSYAPLIFDEFPEIKKSFDGFVNYPNTLSFSTHTAEGAPPMLGGYEYTPEKINNRSEELLKDKNNEAILVMPKLFSDAGFEVTVTDPPSPNYRWKGDLSFMKEYPQINCSEIEGKYYTIYKTEKALTTDSLDIQCRKGCVDFSILQCLPSFMRESFYSDTRGLTSYTGTVFLEQLSNLYYLPQMTDFSSNKNTYTFIENLAAHDITVTLEDDYETVAKVQNNNMSLQHYHGNIAAFKQIAKWLEFLKDNNVYDNTRIIIVSDHGRDVEIPFHNENIAWFSALLMVKDFNAHGEIKTDNQFMTNADTIFIAKEGFDISDSNPFTGKKFVQEKSNGINVYECLEWNIEKLRENTQFELDKSQAWHVSENIYEEKNWIPLNEWKE